VSVTKAYVVNQVVIHDPQRYAEYSALGRAALTQYGGRILAGGGRVETLEGTPIPPRVVVIEFPSYDAAITYYRSPEYQEARAVRGDAATVRFAVVEGVDEPS
jgi:uncharacterized protein (DUF1330 family)